jgi:tripartite-type tricarboxylate transporter receptor subunit TctC
MIDRRTFLVAGAGALSAPFAARAQPAGTTVIWSGFPSGGLGDQVTRPLLERLRGKLPTNFVLDSKPGAGARIAVDFVKRAAADGHTLLQTPSSPMTLYPHIYKKLTYDSVADFVPVTPLVDYCFSFTAGPGLPAEVKTVADYVKWAKANPALANYGVPAAGSALHFGGMLLSRASGADLKSVPYRGGGPLLQDLMGGQVPVSFSVISEVAPHVRSGKLRSLAVTSGQRWPALPDVPTFVEQGFADIVLVEWLGWLAPAGTPVDVVDKLNAAVREAMQGTEMTEVVQKLGLRQRLATPKDFAAMIRADLDRWGPIVKATGFSAED